MKDEDLISYLYHIVGEFVIPNEKLLSIDGVTLTDKGRSFIDGWSMPKVGSNTYNISVTLLDGDIESKDYYVHSICVEECEKWIRNEKLKELGI